MKIERVQVPQFTLGVTGDELKIIVGVFGNLCTGKGITDEMYDTMQQALTEAGIEYNPAYIRLIVDEKEVYPRVRK